MTFDDLLDAVLALVAAACVVMAAMYAHDGQIAYAVIYAVLALCAATGVRR